MAWKPFSVFSGIPLVFFTKEFQKWAEWQLHMLSITHWLKYCSNYGKTSEICGPLRLEENARKHTENQRKTIASQNVIPLAREAISHTLCVPVDTHNVYPKVLSVVSSGRGREWFPKGSISWRSRTYVNASFKSGVLTFFYWSFNLILSISEGRMISKCQKPFVIWQVRKLGQLALLFHL